MAIRGRAHAPLIQQVATGVCVGLPVSQTTHGFLEREPPLYVTCVPTMYKDWKSGNNPMPGHHMLYCLQGGSHEWEFGYREELERITSEVPWFKFVTHD